MLMWRWLRPSVSLYMAGGMALQWLLGPLSDRIGRRPVLLTGALIFTLACLATLFTTSMTQFLIARFVQGTTASALSPPSATSPYRRPLRKKGRSG